MGSEQFPSANVLDSRLASLFTEVNLEPSLKELLKHGPANTADPGIKATLAQLVANEGMLSASNLIPAELYTSIMQSLAYLISASGRYVVIALSEDHN